MKTSPTGRKLIESYEGLILGAYDDANDHIVNPGDPVKGVLTIGYGHTSAAGLPKVFAGQSITKEEADQILAADLSKVEANVLDLVKVPINQNQFDALVSFQFNTGALGKSSSLRYLNEGNYAQAAQNLLLWNKAKQIGPGPIPGLVRRREDEKTLFLKPYTLDTVTIPVTPVTKVTVPVTPNMEIKPMLPWYITMFVDSSKIGGWVRAAVASALTALVAIIGPKYSQYITPELATGLGAAASTVAVGIWSVLTKGSAPVATPVATTAAVTTTIPTVPQVSL